MKLFQKEAKEIGEEKKKKNFVMALGKQKTRLTKRNVLTVK